MPRPIPLQAGLREIRFSSALLDLPTFISSTAFTTASTSRVCRMVLRAAFLVRALEPVAGIEQMAESRGLEKVNETAVQKTAFLKKIASGPDA